MHQGWFFTLFEKLKQKNIAVFGQQELKKIRYNTHKPTLVFGNSSGTDWLDLQLTVTFGNTQASLTDVRKAILNNQKFIPLNDGTIGLLPDDWVTRYAALFKFGKLDKSKVSISKLHISIIDSYLNEINNETLALELHHKKSRLTQFQSIQNQNVPKHINAQLRPYQVSGFEWLQFLNDFNWGGCLADDMGLGKTLQVLTLLQHLKNKQALKTSLVVVPTTLIFNWNNEVEKYCPQLTIYTHHGAQRQWPELWQQYDIILTTYGTLRSDLSTIKNMAFDYVILDESQAIKNPLSQISKAVRVLIAKNRLVMTGTPIENNTFDLYAQMEFLNPGFLGNSDFFRNEFATPIDKYGIEEKAASLRKLIAPFVLKRTKEEVADDLPPKTETVLYCEMGIEQRKLYDSYKEKYRQQILQKIDAEGVAKSGFLILEGLLKLRMICDATAMVADNQREKNYSTKLDELMREITENAGHHKIVVFSQFLKMLDIIKQQLILANIPFEYLDGQTTDRKDRIENFQQNENIRVFLMSLKAGGVGINLTEADYVYLVDPWWNPAVEQQAIDRTHRIGAKKKCFCL
jgi:SNF2 family DNA or RNA helicase